MKTLLTCLALTLLVVSAHAAPPSFRDTAAPEGWIVVKGQAATGAVLQAHNGSTVLLQTAAPLAVPFAATIRFRAALGDDLTCEVAGLGTNPAPPLLRAFFRLHGPNYGLVMTQANGAPMATTTISERTWTLVDKKDGGLSYTWRFPKVKNLWDEPDRREIGAAYAGLVPFAEKVFAFRLVVTAATRQIWLDDRLVAEEQVATPAAVHLTLQLDRTTQVLSAELGVPAATGPFLPLELTHYSHARAAQDADQKVDLVRLPGQVPLWVPQAAQPDIDLGQSLYRYRLSHGPGPDTGYVEAMASWPAAFKVDPATLAFRVPYRNYANVWLLAWLDDRPHAVPRGSVQFFRERAGYPVRTEFAITPEAIKQGLVTKLPQRTAAGHQLYLVKVPVDTAGLYGMHDLADQFLDFELTKPVALARSYPDPIYYGSHPAGWPSAVHVVGITLEEAPFGYEAKPARTGHVFERPQQPAYTVTVTNTTDRPLTARVTMATKSQDRTERGGGTGRTKMAAHGAGTVNVGFELQKLGWHELRVEVEAGGQRRGHTQSLLVLPPNTRTYGNALNETRFGTWNLLGHYTPLDPRPDSPRNEAMLAMFRQLGLRRFSSHDSFTTPAILKRLDFLPSGPHTVGNAFAQAVAPDGTVNPEPMQKGAASEIDDLVKWGKHFPEATYFYGGEWAISEPIQYAPWPAYTGDGDRDLTAEERQRAERAVKIFTAIGQVARQRSPNAKLILQWGAPFGTIAYIKAGMPKDLVDRYGMDAPQFELLPEISNVTGSINQLWQVRQQIAKLGWPQLPMAWCEGPFFPTNPGALTEAEQAEYQVRYWLLGLAYGVEQFEAGVVPHDAGNYYGAEHYGAGIFHRRPLEHPKPAAAAVATATAMLCGSDVVGPVDTGCLTTYCLAFRRAKDQAMIYALWRVNGTVDATIKARGAQPVITDAMGNATAVKLKEGAIAVTLSSSPVWLTGVEQIDGFNFAAPRYPETPAKITRPLALFSADQWAWDSGEDKAYADNHFAIRRITDPNLKPEFGQGEQDRPDAVAITLPVEPGDRPLATRYGQLRLKKPVTIPGKATALGLWVKGNSSWGRVVYQCRDAKGEVWTSVGTKDDWNCDDTHAWSYVSFEGWRYVRFPLPGNLPWDSVRDLETTWWGCHGGDGIVDLPLTLEKIIVEARNEVPYLGVMKLVPERSYKLAGLVAEYDAAANTTDQPIADNKVRLPQPEWQGPAENPIAKLTAEAAGAAPAIKSFVEPSHFNDGRRMIIKFDVQAGLAYNLYLSRYQDGRGADLLQAGVKDGDTVVGFRPDTPMYLFLTAVGADQKESKASAPFPLVTKDNFAEK